MPSSVEDQRFAPATTLSWNDTGDELTLFDSACGRYFALNGPAVAIWRELASGKTVAEANEVLTARFDAPRTVIAKDVADFVRGALDRRLLIALS